LEAAGESLRQQGASVSLETALQCNNGNSIHSQGNGHGQSIANGNGNGNGKSQVQGTVAGSACGRVAA
jgi:hypothetical protein